MQGLGAEALGLRACGVWVWGSAQRLIWDESLHEWECWSSRTLGRFPVLEIRKER